jgi:hypothetical protein
MESIFRMPGRAYEYINYNYGFIGVLVASLLLIMFCLSVYFWFDRRRA